MRQKLLIGLTIVIFVCNLIVLTIGGISEVVNKEKYKEKLIESIAKQVEKTGVTGNAFKLNDFTTNITKEYYGHLFDGNCTFYDGFVSRIEEITGPHYESGLTYDATNQTHVILEFNFHLASLHAIYQLDFTFTDFQDTGTVEFLFIQLPYIVEVISEIDTGKKEQYLRIVSIGNDQQMGFRGYPYHEYMQVIAKQKASYKNVIGESIKEWKTILKTFLDKAVQDVDFPEICYNCVKKIVV